MPPPPNNTRTRVLRAAAALASCSAALAVFFVAKASNHGTAAPDGPDPVVQRRSTPMGAPWASSCPKSKVCTFSNVCLDRRDGVLVPTDSPSPELEAASQLWDLVPVPRRPRFVSPKKSDGHHWWVPGVSMMVNCWRMTTQPAHFMMGVGKLASTTFRNGVAYVDTVVFHQCASPDSAGLFGVFWNITEEDFVASGHADRTVHTLALPFQQDGTKRICFEELHTNPWSIGMYLGATPNDVSRWRHRAAQLYPAELAAVGGASAEAVCTDTCTENLRIGIWHRTEGSALRRFLNMPEVRAAAAKYTTLPIRSLTARSATSAKAQMRMFRDFDILITPHGSHLANMIFATPQSVIIEVAATQFDDIFCANGRVLVGGYLQSFGHRPVLSESQKGERGSSTSTRQQLAEDPASLMQQCPVSSGWRTAEARGENCTHANRLQLVQSDLVVDVEALGASIEQAVRIRCGCEARNKTTECVHG